ncbi:MAG: hypothetical protein ACRCYO_06725 [Bacteroidia bacterium]
MKHTEKQLYDSTISVPPYLQDFWGGYQVLDKTTDRFVNVSAEIQNWLKSYPFWIDKGPIKNQRRLTITCQKTIFKTNEAIRVAHYIEELDSGQTLYVMGPKKITNEFVNDSLHTSVSLDSNTPWLEMEYNGEVVDSPGLDYNFEITEYRFSKAGTYTIYWKPGVYCSNGLIIYVEE